MIAGIGLCLFVAMVLGYQYTVQISKVKESQAQLEMQFKVIAPVSNAEIVDHQSSSRLTHVFIETTYLTDASFADIFNYYDALLKQNGWRLKGTGDLMDWGRDLGGKVAVYCKDDYLAELAFAGQQANYGWTYAFSMSWGFDDCNTE